MFSINNEEITVNSSTNVPNSHTIQLLSKGFIATKTLHGVAELQINF